MSSFDMSHELWCEYESSSTRTHSPPSRFPSIAIVLKKIPIYTLQAKTTIEGHEGHQNRAQN